MLKNIFLISSLLVSALTFANNDQQSSTTAQSKILPEYHFVHSDTLSSEVAQTLAKAKAEQKLALFVLGAKWCHDSEGLAKTFSTSQMQELLTKHYQVLFVDVGFLEKGFELVKQFKQPIYYGTPTVLVVEPNTEQLLNKLTMEKWLNANKVPLNEYLDYFEYLTKNKVLETPQNSQMQAYLKKIEAFEQQQAVRLRKAYKIIGPLLKEYMESDDKKPSENFINKWQPVQDFRYKIQGDIQVLIEQAKNNIKMGKKQPLNFPSYPAFSWEQ